MIRRAAAALVLLALCGCGGREAEAPTSRAAESAPEAAPPPGGGSGKSALEPLEKLTVRVYFPAVGGDGLVAETREIFDTAYPGDRAKQILSDLISGPVTPGALHAVPRGTRLRQVYVLANGEAWADFSEDLALGMTGGSAAEVLAVYAIVDSIALNVPEIRRVGILVGGRERETLDGHLDLRRPLPPDESLVLDLDPAVPPDDAVVELREEM